MTLYPPLRTLHKFYIHGTVRRNSVSMNAQQDATIYSLLYLYCKLL